MFKNILRRLTILNSIVFLLIFITFGGTLYGYVARQLFDDVDRSIQSRVDAFRIINGRPGSASMSPNFFENRVLVLLRDTDGNIINLYPFPVEDITGIISFLDSVENRRMETQKTADHVYRILSVPYQYSENILLRANDTQNRIQDVIAISAVDFEAAMLRRLLIIILIGQAIGMTVIILAGYYLARRALVPIREAWEKQQQFVADASHELRTPLSVIKSNAELLLRCPEHTVEEETIRITNIVRETIRMRKLVSTLLTLARADADQIELQKVPIILNEIVNAVVEQFRLLAEMKGITLEVEIDEEIRIVADKERLYQLFIILLDNAIKYTSQTGRISLICLKRSTIVWIKVADTGCGIPPEDLPKIFNRFFRGDKARSRKNGGTGLGLSIAQWIIEKHGGTIRVESEVSIGTQVYISIPIEKT
jgi:two-component system sensor histidine kinase CiaH